MVIRCRAVAAWLLVSLLLSTAVAAAQSATTPPGSNSPQARSSDVKTIDAIVQAVYDVISGPPEQKRDWNRFRSLFAPNARLMPTVTPPAGKVAVRMLGVDDYITRSEPLMEKEGFVESEAARRTEQFGNIAHVWSTYESRHKPNEKPFARGINSIQLMNDGERWWIVNILWQNESAQHPVPEKYLGSGDR